MLSSTHINEIRERFQKHAGALCVRAFTEHTPVTIDPVAVVMMHKAAQADSTLFGVALELSPGDPYTMYERLGGCYTLKKDSEG
jgi:hypothetical protein